MTNPSDTKSLREQIALVLGWKPPEHPDTKAAIRERWDRGVCYYDGVWLSLIQGLTAPLHFPPWDTDDGLAIKVAEEWCDRKPTDRVFEHSYYDGINNARFCTPADDGLGSADDASLARAICEALIVAKEGMG